MSRSLLHGLALSTGGRSGEGQELLVPQAATTDSSVLCPRDLPTPFPILLFRTGTGLWGGLWGGEEAGGPQHSEVSAQTSAPFWKLPQGSPLKPRPRAGAGAGACPPPPGFLSERPSLRQAGGVWGPARGRGAPPDAGLALSPVCGCDLAEGGFFLRQGEHICTRDYQRLYGTRCFSCDRFIEGEVVSALGRTYHPDCFVCAVCR